MRTNFFPDQLKEDIFNWLSKRTIKRWWNVFWHTERPAGQYDNTCVLTTYLQIKSYRWKASLHSFPVLYSSLSSEVGNHYPNFVSWQQSAGWVQWQLMFFFFLKKLTSLLSCQFHPNWPPVCTRFDLCHHVLSLWYLIMWVRNKDIVFRIRQLWDKRSV